MSQKCQQTVLHCCLLITWTDGIVCSESQTVLISFTTQNSIQETLLTICILICEGIKGNLKQLNLSDFNLSLWRLLSSSSFSTRLSKSGFLNLSDVYFEKVQARIQQIFVQSRYIYICTHTHIIYIYNTYIIHNADIYHRYNISYTYVLHI